MSRYEIQTLIEVTGLESGLLTEVISRRLVICRQLDEHEVELDEVQVARLRRIRRLITDFDLNLETLELVLALVDEIERLRASERSR